MLLFQNAGNQQAPANKGLIDKVQSILDLNSEWWFQAILVLVVVGLVIALSLRIPKAWERTKDVDIKDKVARKRKITSNQFWTIWGISIFAVSSMTLVGLLVPKLMATIYAGIVISCIFIFEFRSKQHHDEQQENTATFQKTINDSLGDMETKIVKLQTSFQTAKENLSESYGSYLKLEEHPRQEISNATSDIWKQAPVISEHFGRGGVNSISLKEMKALMSITSYKAKDTFDQLLNEEIYCRSKAFGSLWPALVNCSDQYLSICDLSSLSRLDSTAEKTVSEIWKDRILGREYDDAYTGEINKLIEFAKSSTLEIFDKVIVYQPMDGEKISTKKKPKCVTSAENKCCASGSCETPCVVNTVLKSWLSKKQDLIDVGLKSASDDDKSIIWLVTLNEFKTIGTYASKAHKAAQGKVLSLDLGFFGNNIIGEEFKINEVRLPGWAGETSRSRAAQTPKVTHDYLYRFQVIPTLSRQIRKNIIDDMNNPEKNISSVS